MEKTFELKDFLKKKWSFRWGLMDVLIGGKSPIDLKKLGLTDRVKAKKFVESYGFYCDKDGDLRFIHKTIVEALSFIERDLMPREWNNGIKPPDEVLMCNDILQILTWASAGEKDGHEGLYAVWACAILRVVHTIAHIHGVQRHADVDEA